MLSLFAILAQNVYTRVGDRVDEEVSTAKRTAIAGLAIGLLAGTAYVLAVVATAILLAGRYGAVPALFGLAGGFFVVALIVLAALVVKNRRERELRRIRREQLAARRDLVTAAAALTMKRPFAATGLALALGFLFAPKSRRRD
jgi:drug/metabolite transporter (DMT)-like permease